MPRAPSAGMQLPRPIASADHLKLDRSTASIATPADVATSPSNSDPMSKFRVTRNERPVFDTDGTNSVDTDAGTVEAARGIHVEKHLPDEVVDMIISKMPFPFLFKARALSRKWHFKFPFASPLVRTFPCDFQDFVSEVSGKWTSYCPVYFTLKKEIVSFDRTLARWRPVIDFSHLKLECWSCISCAGSLVCLASHSSITDEFDIYIANILTQSFRIVRSYYFEPLYIRLVLVGSKAYKVFVVPVRYATLSGYDDDEVSAGGVHIYDSSSRTWIATEMDTIPEDDVDLAYFFQHSAYVDGTLYGMGKFPDECVQLWRYDVEDNIWTHILSRFDLVCETGGVGGLVLCGNQVMVCITKTKTVIGGYRGADVFYYTYPNSIQIFQLDLASLLLKEVSVGPPEVVVKLSEVDQFFENPVHMSADSKFIYFSGDDPNSGTVFTFDVEKLEWGFLPNTGASYSASYSQEHNEQGTYSFQPGINPFLIP